MEPDFRVERMRVRNCRSRRTRFDGRKRMRLTASQPSIREFILTSNSHTETFPQLLEHFSNLHQKNLRASVSECPRASLHSFQGHFFIKVFQLNFECENPWQRLLARERAALPNQRSASMMYSVSTLGTFGRGALAHLRSMSPTSHLTHHPFGAAVARSPNSASGGGGEGWSIPLVSQSERGWQRGPQPRKLMPARSRLRGLRVFGVLFQSSGRIRTRPGSMTEKLPAQSSRATIRSATRCPTSPGGGIGIRSGRLRMSWARSMLSPTRRNPCRM